MNIETVTGEILDSSSLVNYFKSLVNNFFKILPMREKNEESLKTYMRSLQIELLGLSSLILTIKEDTSYIRLLSILQYLIDNPECDTPIVKREVFKAINLCNKIRASMLKSEVSK